MKKDFIGYYNPTVEEVDLSWDKGVFAFDANTLLNLYRYSANTSEDFLKALATLKERIYLPYQAAFEFMRNRERVISSMQSAYSEVLNITKGDIKGKLDSQLNSYKKHPLIKIQEIQNLYDEFHEKVRKELDVQKASHPNLKEKDEILEKVTELFNTSTGTDHTEAKLEDIFKEGELRYKKQVPPGYKDLTEKKDRPLRELYGDLIIWKDLIEFCKLKKQPLILITDDNKEDWWLKENGETKRPRPELIKEFYDLTGIRILIYNPDQFLAIAKERNLIKTVNEETLKEIKDIRLQNETAVNWKFVNTLLWNSLKENSSQETTGKFLYEPVSYADLLKLTEETDASKFSYKDINTLYRQLFNKLNKRNDEDSDEDQYSASDNDRQ